MQRGWIILALVMCVSAAGHFNRISISVAGSEAIIDPTAGSESTSSPQTHQGISPTKMGTVYTSFLVMYTLFMIPGGWLIDWIGPKWSLAIMCMGSAVFTALTGVAGLLLQEPAALWVGLLVVRSLMGMINAPLHPAGARMVANWIPRSAVSLANGMVTFAGCLGMGIVYVAFGKLIDVFQWPIAFLITGGLSMLLAVCWMALAADSDKDGTTREPQHDLNTDSESLWSLFSNRSLVGLTISYSAVGYFQYLFFYWMEYYFEKVLHLEKDTSRWLSTAMVVSMGLGMVLGGKLADMRSAAGGKHAHRLVPVACLLISGVMVLVAVLSPNYHVKIGLFLISMAAVGGTEGSYWAQSVVLGRSRGGTAAAMMNTGGNVGGLLAPVVTPYIADRLGWQSGLGMASAVCAFGAVLWYMVDTPKVESAEEPPS